MDIEHKPFSTVAVFTQEEATTIANIWSQGKSHINGLDLGYKEYNTALKAESTSPNCWYITNKFDPRVHAYMENNHE